MRKTYISKIVPLALSLELFLTACGSAENAAADEAETTAATVSSSAAQTTLETEAETVQETENTSPDLTGRPADELFEYTVYDDHVVINKFILSGEEIIEAKITVPEYIEGVPVTEIGKQAFYYSSGNDRMDFISEIVLPDSIEIIGEGAFSGCGSTIGLKLNLPKNLKELGYNAFGHSGLYGEIVIPGTISRLEDYAFKSCSFLKSVIIENGVTAIGNSCFDECEDLSNVVIPDSVTSIGEYCFSRCTSLSSIDIPESVTVFGRDVFSSTPIVEANQPLIINDILLDHSSAEGEVIIPENVTRICDYAYDHSELTSIVIPDSVTEIGRGAFSFCKKLESVTLPKNITEISGVTFNRCDNLKSISIPDSVTYIGDKAFGKCTNLVSVSLPSGAELGENVFSETPISEDSSLIEYR
ncbi:MAG: leucine-rich repeat domain-containing protein [Oscillospiraceae bacterium]|nr:leucine-rich repeat domain-containing protein [Oscillospiraceae bacterium]